MNSRAPRGLYLACYAILLFYVVNETGKIFFGLRAPQWMVDRSLWFFMVCLAFGIRSWWPLLYPVGADLNRLVMSLNGGYMPVVGGVPLGATHIAADDHSRLLLFADRFRLLWGGESSIGDMLIIIGLWAALCRLGVLVVSRATSPPSAPSPPPRAPCPS